MSGRNTPYYVQHLADSTTSLPQGMDYYPSDSETSSIHESSQTRDSPPTTTPKVMSSFSTYTRTPANMSPQLSPRASNAALGSAAANPNASTANLNAMPQQPMRAFFPSGTAADGTPLYSLQTLNASSCPGSCNSSTSTLVQDNLMFQVLGVPPLPVRSPRRKYEYDSTDSLLPAPVPSKKHGQTYRWMRWNFGSVYRRIFSIAFFANVAAIIALSIQHATGSKFFSYEDAANAVAANLLAAMVIRNEHIVNMMFQVFINSTERLPLRMRHLCAKVYSYGGIHSGCGVAATFWYIAFLVLMTRQMDTTLNPIVRGYIFLVSYAIIFCLCTILFFAHPTMRVKLHNWFEGIHRFVGWTVVALFWVQVLGMASDKSTLDDNLSMGQACVNSPSFWMVILITLLVIYPWARLRQRNITVEPMSKHVTKINFDYRNAQFGQAIRLADWPLRETHAFAVIPNPPAPKEVDLEKGEGEGKEVSLSNAGKKGFSVLVSHAGDWTRKIIDNPPDKLYTRGVPQYGVLRVAGLFKTCIVVATGSGIGPCLSLFVQRPDHPVRIVWSTKKPAETYGQTVVDLLKKTDPNAVILDTHKTGRPDLVGEIWRIWEESRRVNGGKNACEAVVMISNQKVTRKVIYGLESRGIPAYGAIFDS